MSSLGNDESGFSGHMGAKLPPRDGRDRASASGRIAMQAPTQSEFPIHALGRAKVYPESLFSADAWQACGQIAHTLPLYHMLVGSPGKAAPSSRVRALASCLSD